MKTGKCNEIGVFGLGVMGSSLALNIESRGIPISVYNYEFELTRNFIEGPGKGKKVFAAKTIYEFVSSLERPRKILMMVTAGKVVDIVIDRLKPHLQPGDILIDGGNSHFSDTDRRQEMLEDLGIQYVGMGVSGGEEGALKGPCLMPGGEEGAYQFLEPVLRKIAAKAPDGSPCVAYIGPKSAGHFVKMVHNGIEYGDMQLICEAYDLLRFGLGLSTKEVSEVFKEWNRGELNSYLVEISSKIVNFPDDLGSGALLDKIKGKAGMKGTGTWTGTAALDLGEPIPTIISALHARALSALESERTAATGIYEGGVERIEGDRKALIKQIEDALFASKLCSYAQGFVLLSAASKEYKYGLKMSEIASIWRGGCIIRAKFLEKISEAFQDDPKLDNLLIDRHFSEKLKPRVPNWRNIVSRGVSAGFTLPAMTASLSYFEALRRERLPANLIQAQRDFFGAHTYQRMDREGTFHTKWK